MRIFNKKRISILTVLALIVQLHVPYFTGIVFAEDTRGLSVKIKEEIITGTETFNTTGKATAESCPPGDDYSKNDNYIRTLDTVGYTIDYSVNPEGYVAKNSVLTATLSAGTDGNPIVVWDSNLKNLYLGLTISSDGRTLKYDLGDKKGGNAYSFSPTAKVLGTSKNGEKFNLDVTFAADDVSSVSDTSRDIIVSAFPKLDLGVDIYNSRPALGPSGELGLVVYSTIDVLIKDGKGSESVNEDLNFDVDLSQLRSLGMNPKIYDFSLDEKAVAPHGDYGWIHWHTKRPYGKGGGDNKVTSSGTFTANQFSPGDDVNITISDADLSGNHTPIQNADGSTIALDDKYVVCGTLALWIPGDEIPVEDTEIEISYKNFDPNAISGQSNFGTEIEPISNNTDRTTIRRPVGIAGATIDEWYEETIGGKLSGEDEIWDHDGVILSGGKFNTHIRFWNTGLFPFNDAIVVNKFDPNLVDLVEKSPGIAHTLRTSGIDPNDIIVEYGVGGANGDSGYDDWIEMRNSTGDDSDSTGGWYENINDAPGAITKIRFKTRTGIVPVKGQIELLIHMKAKNNPIGTNIPNFLSVKANEIDTGKWKHTSYNPDNNTPPKDSQSDRALLTGVKARIELKSSKDTVSVGDTATYTLSSSLTSKGNDGTAEDVVITTTLPKGLDYVSGSAKKNLLIPGDEPQIIKNPDETTTLIWNLGDRQINTMVEVISFDAKIDYEVENLTSLNTIATISTPLDVTKESFRTSQKSIVISNSRAWGISKRADVEEVEIEEDLCYTLRYFQRTDKTLKSFEFIEVLPYNGDGRIPNTSFSGDYGLKSISGSYGETFLVTDESPESINQDPKVGGTTWSPIGTIDDKNVTAIKILVPEFPNNQPTREIKLILNPTENKGGDIYTNKFTGRVSDIDALVESNNVSIKVVSSSVDGLVWKDLNENGKVDPDEKGISNVKVEILDDSETVIETKTTDENGKYTFGNLKSGNYKVQIEDESLKNYNQTYEYDGSLDQVVTISLSKKQKLTDINFGYKQNEGKLEVRYLEKGTDNELLPKEESTKSVGENYKTEKKEVEGYKFVNVDGSENGKYVEGKTVVTYYYEKQDEVIPEIKKGRVVVIHKWGEKVLKFEDLGEEEVGTQYTTNSLTEEEYKDFKVIVPENKDGKYEEGTIEVIYYYINTNPSRPDIEEKKIGEVVVKYLEKNTAKKLVEEDLLKDEVGKNYKTQDKQIDGYKLVEKPSNAQGQYIEGKIEVVYYYEKEIEKPIEPEKKIGEVIVKYLEKNTNKELAEGNLLKDEVGKDYKTQDKQIDGYKLVENTLNTQGQYIEGKIEVIYYYEKERPKKKKRKPKEEKIEIPNQEIPQEKSEVKVDIPDEEVPQGKLEVEVEISDEEVPQGKLEVEVEIPDEEVPQGKMKVLPKTGEKVPYSNYLMGTLIMILGGALSSRRRKNS
ncbi:MucBP domain-containing protein [Tepidibacter sp. Z1-5]|uniref:MucBP domain-containing protein n=1 Tax=Tepidibacter sp. Z1-5 TaxID=3134138 RepID=UPI0030C54EFF